MATKTDIIKSGLAEEGKAAGPKAMDCSRHNKPQSDAIVAGNQQDTFISNGDINKGMLANDKKSCSPPPERKPSKFATLGRLFKPWKWKRRKKASEKIEKAAVDLERKISVRAAREDLIKRGVLQDGENNGKLSLNCKELVSTELESVKENKNDSTQVQANGTASTDGDLHMPNIVSGAGEGVDGPLPQTEPHLESTASLSPEHQLQGTLTTQAEITRTHPHYVVSPSIYAGEEINHPESSIVEPQQVQVMLPVEDQEREKHIPVILHKAIPQIPVLHESAVPTLQSEGHPSPYARNNKVFTPTGLTFQTPGPRPHSPVVQTFSTPPGGQPNANTPAGIPFDEVPVHEPDPNKKPIRSALKGAKRQVLFQQQLQQKLLEKQRLSISETGSVHVGVGAKMDGITKAPPKVAPKPRVKLNSKTVCVIDPANKENQPENYFNSPDYDNLHSDSDEEIKWDDRDRESILAAKVQRQDSLARFLSQRPNRLELIERNILPDKTEQDRAVEREYIGSKLNRRLSLRPSADELEAKNILHRKTLEEMRREKEEMKRTLIRKLSFRPTVDELKERKIIKFSDYVEVTEVSEYDRRADKPWTRLTPKDKAAIRKELNEFKSSEMDVHDESRHLTRFHRP